MHPGVSSEGDRSRDAQPRSQGPSRPPRAANPDRKNREPPAPAGTTAAFSPWWSFGTRSPGPRKPVRGSPVPAGRATRGYTSPGRHVTPQRAHGPIAEELPAGTRKLRGPRRLNDRGNSREAGLAGLPPEWAGLPWEAFPWSCMGHAHLPLRLPEGQLLVRNTGEDELKRHR